MDIHTNKQQATISNNKQTTIVLIHNPKGYWNRFQGTFPGRLHARREIDGISKETISRHFRSNDPSGTRA